MPINVPAIQPLRRNNLGQGTSLGQALDFKIESQKLAREQARNDALGEAYRLIQNGDEGAAEAIYRAYQFDLDPEHRDALAARSLASADPRVNQLSARLFRKEWTEARAAVALRIDGEHTDRATVTLKSLLKKLTASEGQLTPAISQELANLEYDAVKGGVPELIMAVAPHISDFPTASRLFTTHGQPEENKARGNQIFNDMQQGLDVTGAALSNHAMRAISPDGTYTGNLPGYAKIMEAYKQMNQAIAFGGITAGQEETLRDEMDRQKNDAMGMVPAMQADYSDNERNHVFKAYEMGANGMDNSRQREKFSLSQSALYDKLAEGEVTLSQDTHSPMAPGRNAVRQGVVRVPYLGENGQVSERGLAISRTLEDEWKKSGSEGFGMPYDLRKMLAVRQITQGEDSHTSNDNVSNRVWGHALGISHEDLAEIFPGMAEAGKSGRIQSVRIKKK